TGRVSIAGMIAPRLGTSTKRGRVVTTKRVNGRSMFGRCTREQRRRVEPDQRVAGFAGCQGSDAFLGLAVKPGVVIARPEAGGTIVDRDGRQLPNDIDLKLLPARDRGPQIMVAMRILGGRTGVDFDGLGEPARNAVAAGR